MATGRWDSRTEDIGPAAFEAPAGTAGPSIRALLGLPLSAVLVLAMGQSTRSSAQGPPPVAAPPAHDAEPSFAAPGPAPMPLTPTPPPSCTCGDRHGLRRLRWHRTQCRRGHQAKWLGYPEEFNEWQLGRALYSHGSTQVANGEAARMYFYDYDFVDGTGQLNHRGREKLAAVTEALPTNFFAVGVEPTPHTPGLDQSRRLALLSRLATGPFPVPGERVVIGPPIARGRGGAESLLVERNRLGTAASGGILGGSGAVGTGSLDGSGLTGSTISPGVR